MSIEYLSFNNEAKNQVIISGRIKQGWGAAPPSPGCALSTLNSNDLLSPWRDHLWTTLSPSFEVDGVPSSRSQGSVLFSSQSMMRSRALGCGLCPCLAPELAHDTDPSSTYYHSHGASLTAAEDDGILGPVRAHLELSTSPALPMHDFRGKIFA